MYQLQRLVSYVIHKRSDCEEHIITKSNVVFTISDKEFKFLSNLKTEYDYELADNVICIDRHPSVLQGHISEDFIWDYSRHMSEKFFVLYEYKKIEDV